MAAELYARRQGESINIRASDRKSDHCHSSAKPLGKSTLYALLVSCAHDRAANGAKQAQPTSSFCGRCGAAEQYAVDEHVALSTFIQSSAFSSIVIERSKITLS